MHSPQHNISCSADNFLALNLPRPSDFSERLLPAPPVTQKQRRIRKPQATGVYLLTPADLVIPEDHKDVENEIRYYLHVILTGINNRKHEIEGWARINRELMRSIVGDAAKEGKARTWLLENHVMGTEFSYSSTRHVSNSYYMHPDYEDHINRWETTKKRLAYKLRLMRSLRFEDNSLQHLDEATAWNDLGPDEQSVYHRLKDWCGQLHIDLDACRTTMRKLNKSDHDITMATAELIGTDNADYKVDNYFRFHSPLTRLYTPLRSHLSFDGKKLVNVDIRNSQVVFFLKVMQEHLLDAWVKEDDKLIEKEARRISELAARGLQLNVTETKEEEPFNQTSETSCLMLNLYSDINRTSPFTCPITRPSPLSLCCTNKNNEENKYNQVQARITSTFSNSSTTATPLRPLSLCCRNRRPLVGGDVAQFCQLVENGQIYDFLLNQINSRDDDALEVSCLGRLNRKAKEAIWKRRYRAFCCEHPVTTADEARRRRDAYARRHRLKDITITPITELTRDDLKRLFFADVFYGRVQVDTPLTRLFARNFPSVYYIIVQCKSERYQDLARMMQKEEAKFMLHTVCRRLLTYHSEVPIFTIHDSIMTTEEHVLLVKRIIGEEFARIGLDPTLKEE